MSADVAPQGTRADHHVGVGNLRSRAGQDLPVDCKCVLTQKQSLDALQDCQNILSKVDTSEKSEDLQMVKQAAQDTISGLLTPIKAILKKVGHFLEPAFKGRVGRHQALSNSLKALKDMISQSDKRSEKLLDVVKTAREVFKADESIMLLKMGPHKRTLLKSKDSNLL